MSRDLTAIINEIVLGEAEENCDQHVHIVRVRFIGDRQVHDPALIAALLRIIALYIDGRCATRGANDTDIVKASGIAFYFTSEDKAEEFKIEMRHYLDTDVLLALAIS